MGSPDPAEPLAAGARIGPYVVERRLGEGATSVVYEVVEPRIRKRAAAKVFKEGVLATPADFERVVREARIANEIAHPGIVDVFDYGELAPGRPYLVMSLLEGRSLKDELAARAKLPPGEAWRILRAVALALDVAHRAGVVHRDVKPDNIFLDGAEATPRLCDFGLAKTMPQPDQLSLTQTGRPVGTPLYMAPEQWWGKGVDARVDQYALGVVLFELLTGRAPFVEETFVDMLQAHLHRPAPTLASAGLDAGPAVEALLGRLLAKDKAERFPSMAEVVREGDRAFAPPDRDGSLATTTTASLTTAAGPDAPRPSVAVEPNAAAQRRPRETTAEAPRRLASTMVTLVTLAAGLALVRSVGYAGPTPHAVREWLIMCGAAGYLTALLFLLFSVVALAMARRRSGDRSAGILSVLGATLLFLPGPTAHLGLNKVHAVSAPLELAERFLVLHVGTYEATTIRFVGYAAASLAFLVLAQTAPRSGRQGPSRADWGALAAFAALGLVGVALQAWGVALVAAVALATVLGASGWRDEDDGFAALAALVATTTMFLATLARLSGRTGFAWTDALARDERVATLTMLGRETSVTLGLGLVVVALAAILEGRRLWFARHALRRSPRAGVAAALFVATLAWDGAYVARAEAARAKVAGELAPQFALFAALDPPTTKLQPPAAYAPLAAPALQVSREIIAVQGKRLTRVDALGSEAARGAVANVLCPAIAERDRESRAPDLSLMLDARTSAATLAPLFALAHACGARRLELLLQRGGVTSLPPGAPAEAAFVIPSDFRAVRLELADGGVPYAGDAAALTRAAEAAATDGKIFTVYVAAVR